MKNVADEWDQTIIVCGDLCMKVYYSVPKTKLKKILLCGLNIDEYGDGEFLAGGKKHKCVFAFLIPGDVKYDKNTHSLLEIEVDPLLTHVAEGAYRGAFSTAEELPAQELTDLTLRCEQLYEDSRVLLSDYKFGSYAKPECPIVLSLLPGSLSMYDEKRGEPIVYEDSEALYAENVFDDFCRKYGDIRLYSVRCCCENLCKAGKMQKIRMGNSLVFIDVKTKKKTVIPGR